MVLITSKYIYILAGCHRRWQPVFFYFFSAFFLRYQGKRIIYTLIHPKKNAISQGANLKTAGSPATRQFALELYTLPLPRQQTGVFFKFAPFLTAFFLT